MTENIKKAILMFTDMSDEDFNYLPYDFQKKKLKKHENFVVNGQFCREIGFINSGLLRMYYLQDGKEINTQFFFENDFAASYPSFLSETPSRYFIQALEDTDMTIFHYSQLQDAYNKSHRWERFGRKIAECCFMEFNARAESLLFMTGEQRYLSLLENHPRIFERVSLFHIASYLGIERESLSRLRKKIMEP